MSNDKKYKIYLTYTEDRKERKPLSKEPYSQTTDGHITFAPENILIKENE